MFDIENTEQGQLKSNPNAAFSEKLDDFRNALNALYISKNLSGRNKFREKWPDVALHLFGETLVEYDNEGAPSVEEREEQEEEAEIRRIELKKILSEFEANSVESGFLKLEYIGSIIDQLGVNLATHLYADRVIERARPGLLKKAQPLAEVPLPKPEEKLSQAEVEILKNKSESTPAKPLPPKGTLKSLFNWLSTQRPKDVKTA